MFPKTAGCAAQGREHSSQLMKGGAAKTTAFRDISQGRNVIFPPVTLNVRSFRRVSCAPTVRDLGGGSKLSPTGHGYKGTLLLSHCA